MLYIDGFVHLLSLLYRWFCELPSASELLYNAGLLKLAFEFLQSFLYVLTFFDRYYDHCFTTSFLFAGTNISLNNLICKQFFILRL